MIFYELNLSSVFGQEQINTSGKKVVLIESCLLTVRGTVSRDSDSGAASPLSALMADDLALDSSMNLQRESRLKSIPFTT